MSRTARAAAAGHIRARRRSAGAATGALAAVALLLAACGEDGPSTLSADDLAQRAESICRTATRGIDDLDPEDPEEHLEESVALLTTASDALEALQPGDDERGDYEDFTASISDQVRQVRRIAAAVEDGDDARVATELADLEELTAEGDEVAEDLDLARCVGLGRAAVAAVATGAPSPTTTTPTGTTVEDTVASTTAPTLPATTVPVITTAPPTAPPTVAPTIPPTAPPVTDPPTTQPGVDDDEPDGNVMDNWVAPDGYTFERETGDIFVLIFPSPRNDPVIAPLFTRYEVGALNGPGGSMVMMVLEITEDFTDPPIDAYISFENNDVGSTVTSPAGWKMWVSPAQPEETFDSTMVFFGRYAITLRTDPGVDALPILDSFIDNNFE